MKRFMCLIVGLSLLFLVSGVVGANQGVLKVATEAGFMPFEFVDEDTNQLAGFDIDLIHAIGNLLGYEVQVSNINWDGLIPALINKNYDAVIAGMTITEERAQSVNFSEPYFESVLTIVLGKDVSGVSSLDDLAGKTVAVQINTTGDFAAEGIAGVKGVLRYNTVAEAMQALIIKAADAAVIDLPVAEAYLAANPNAPLKQLGPVADSEFFGIAVHKQNTQLVEQINEALTILRADGTYDQIFDKWFGVK